MPPQLLLSVTQEREEVQCWWDIVEDRPVSHFLAPVITDYIRGLQDKGTGGEGTHMILLDLEDLWSGTKMIDSQQTTITVANVCLKMEGQS